MDFIGGMIIGGMIIGGMIIGGMIIGGAATLFVILLCASGKDDDK